jgi:hypothetical protein
MPKAATLSVAYGNAALYINPSYTASPTDPQANLLKFSFENRKELGLEDSVIISSVNKISTLGDSKRVGAFISWLHGKGEDDYIRAIITASPDMSVVKHILLDCPEVPLALLADGIKKAQDGRKMALKVIKQDQHALVHSCLDAGDTRALKNTVELTRRLSSDGGVRMLLVRRYLGKKVKPSLVQRLEKAGQYQTIIDIYDSLDPKKQKAARHSLESFRRVALKRVDSSALRADPTSNTDQICNDPQPALAANA